MILLIARKGKKIYSQIKLFEKRLLQIYSYSAELGGLHDSRAFSSQFRAQNVVNTYIIITLAWHHCGILIGQSLSRMSSYKYVIPRLCLWSTGLRTRGFSFDRPLALRARVLSKLATRVQPVDHAPPSYNIYLYLIDIDECERDTDLCGDNGDCINILGGGFYSCDCNDGYTQDGDPSDNTLTCVGRYFNSYSYHSTHKLSILALTLRIYVFTLKKQNPTSMMKQTLKVQLLAVIRLSRCFQSW